MSHQNYKENFCAQTIHVKRKSFGKMKMLFTISNSVQKREKFKKKLKFQENQE
jgi:hypothetical protein